MTASEFPDVMLEDSEISESLENDGTPVVAYPKLADPDWFTENDSLELSVKVPMTRVESVLPVSARLIAFPCVVAPSFCTA